MLTPCVDLKCSRAIGRQSKPWDTDSIEGFTVSYVSLAMFHDGENNFSVTMQSPTKEELKVLHKTIRM